MFKGKFKLAVLIVTFVALICSVKVLQSGAPSDPLKEWAYPKVKRGVEGTNQPPLVWAKFTTTDAFEKVWDFYWRKVTHGAPVKLPPHVKSGTLYCGPAVSPAEHTICAHFTDENPTAKLGVFVVRRKQQTVSITIIRRAKEKVTTIIVAVDQR